MGIIGLLLGAIWQVSATVRRNYATRMFERDVMVFINNMARLYGNSPAASNSVSSLSALYSMGVLPGPWVYAAAADSGVSGQTTVIDGTIPLPYPGVAISQVNLGGVLYSSYVSTTCNPACSYGIPGSRENPKISGINDAEVIGD
jgi:hypothetical protein